MIQWTEILIAAGAAMVAAVGIRIYRRAAARDRGPSHIHEALMKRADALADKSPFLHKVTREFKANGHISNRQAEAVKKAIAQSRHARLLPERGPPGPHWSSGPRASGSLMNHERASTA